MSCVHLGGERRCIIACNWELLSCFFYSGSFSVFFCWLKTISYLPNDVIIWIKQFSLFWIWENGLKSSFVWFLPNIFFILLLWADIFFLLLFRASPIDSISPEDSFHSFSSVLCKVKVKLLSCVWLFATPWTAWTVAHQAPPSLGFSRQEYWSGLPCKYLPIVWKVTEAQSHIPENTQAPLSLPSQETLVQETMKKLSYTKAPLQSSLESMAFLFSKCNVCSGSNFPENNFSHKELTSLRYLLDHLTR